MTHRTFAQCILGILLAVCLGVYFYAQWDMKRFDASLPEPPPADTAVEIPMETAGEDTGDEPSAGHWHGDEWHEEPHTAEPAPPAQPVQSAAEPKPERELPPWLTEWRAALEYHKAESKRLREQSRVLSADWEALRRARDENQISPEEYAREQGNIVARLNAITREKQEQAAALQTAKAKIAKGGTN